jgi:hypothetical protein
MDRGAELCPSVFPSLTAIGVKTMRKSLKYFFASKDQVLVGRTRDRAAQLRS